jgi:2-polyprenyl-3-methyl-5-hydroxy-6-metoxy-1,4-benzoquinol methylase
MYSRRLKQRLDYPPPPPHGQGFSGKTIDDVKSYWNNRPCNIKHSNKEIGTKEYFDEVEWRKYFVEPHIPLFAEFDKWKGKSVLEIGCGIGTDTINFARAGAEVTACDLSVESIELAKKRAVVYGLQDKITFYNVNAEHLSDVVPIKKYDLVYSFGVIHHTPNPENVIEQIKLYISEKSVFKIMVYNRASWKVLWMHLTYGKCRFWKLDEIIAENSEAQTGCPVTYSYTKKTIKRLLSGLKTTNIFCEHIFSYSIPQYKEYVYKKVWYFRIMPKALFRLLERAVGWHLCAEAKLQGKT